MKLKTLAACLKPPYGAGLVGRTTLWGALAGLLLLTTFSACSSDDIHQPDNGGDKGFAPKIVATVDQSPLTKAGVIENNDYKLGEKFYWCNGDTASVYFVPSGGTPWYREAKVTYTASVATGVQSNSCAFTATRGGVYDGEYTVYGFYPASLWGYASKHALDDPAVALSATLPATQTQPDRTSAHLGAYMPIKAHHSAVEVSGGGVIELNYKQMASMIRFAVWNKTGNDNLKMTKITLKSDNAVFGTKGTLADINGILPDINATSLTIDDATKSSGIGLSLTGTAQDFAIKAGDDKSLCEGYVVVLPTAANAFAPTDKLVLELSFTTTEGVSYTASYPYTVGTDLSFLAEGIQQGKSYYIQQKVESGDLLEAKSYALGDYYPDPDVDLSKPLEKAKIEGIVYWLDSPGVGNKSQKGLVVSLTETVEVNWGNAKIKCAKSADWHLPTMDELQFLYCNYNEKPVETWTDYYSPSFSQENTSAARITFNKKMTDAGGSEVTDSNYWIDGEHTNYSFMYCIDFTNGYLGSEMKTKTYHARAVRAF